MAASTNAKETKKDKQIKKKSKYETGSPEKKLIILMVKTWRVYAFIGTSVKGGFSGIHNTIEPYWTQK